MGQEIEKVKFKTGFHPTKLYSLDFDLVRKQAKRITDITGGLYKNEESFFDMKFKEYSHTCASCNLVQERGMRIHYEQKAIEFLKWSSFLDNFIVLCHACHTFFYSIGQGPHFFFVVSNLSIPELVRAARNGLCEVESFRYGLLGRIFRNTTLATNFDITGATNLADGDFRVEIGNGHYRSLSVEDIAFVRPVLKDTFNWELCSGDERYNSLIEKEEIERKKKERDFVNGFSRRKGEFLKSRFAIPQIPSIHAGDILKKS